ncbi:MAG: substrate-binding domain-containing protein [Rhizobiaceae bacterium]
MPEKTVNLKQLSKHLGLSQTTVSRALNGFPEVSEKTRQKVRLAADKFNYRPSPSASSLATGKARIIGHVVPVSEHRMINPHFSDFLAGASDAYAQAGYDLLIRAAQPDEEAGIYRDFVSRNRVDGVVVHGPRVNETRIEFLQSIGLPFVVHGRAGGEEHSYSWLDVDNRSAIEKLTNYLIDLGHRRIALINGLETMNFAHRRRLGYEAALQDHGIDVDPVLISSRDMNEPYGYEATMAKLDMPNPPTAFIYSSVLSALGGMRAANMRGLLPGQDISLATFDDRLSFLQSGGGENGGKKGGDSANGVMGAGSTPYMTSVSSSIQDAGRRVGEMLMDQISNPGTPPVCELWKTDLIIGTTTGKPA